MNIWTQAEYEKFSHAISKSSMKLAFDILFYTGMRSGELLALTPTDILPNKRIDINKNYAKIKGEELFLEPKTPKAKRCISIPDFLFRSISRSIFQNSMALEIMTEFSISKRQLWKKK